MYGWRAKLGLLIPANNTVIEPELTRYLPDGVSLHATRMVVEGPFASEALLRMEQSAARGLNELAQSQVDVQVYACMSTSLVKGREWDEAFTRRLEAPSGRVALFTAAAATMAALRALGVGRVAVLSPYPPTIHPLLRPFFASYGFDIDANVNLEISDYAAVNQQSPEQIYRIGRSIVTPGTEAVCLLATDLPTFPAIEALERDLRLPVVSTNQAILWCALHAAGVSETISGIGRLLSEMPPTAGE